MNYKRGITFLTRKNLNKETKSIDNTITGIAAEAGTKNNLIWKLQQSDIHITHENIINWQGTFPKRTCSVKCPKCDSKLKIVLINGTSWKLATLLEHIERFHNTKTHDNSETILPGTKDHLDGYYRSGT